MEKKYLTTDATYFPMLASDPQKNELSRKEKLALWEKFDALPDEKKNVLLHEDTPDKIYQVCRKFNLSQEQGSLLSLTIRDVAFENMNPSQISQEIHTHLPLLDENSKRQLVQFTVELFTSSPEKEDITKNTPQSPKKGAVAPPNLKTLPLIQALSKFPKLGNQLITSEELTMRGNSQPVRASVKNWITIYQQEMGPAPHEPFERSNFLFHNSNALKLSKEERDKLNAVLESLDENKPLNIEPMSHTLIWKDAPHDNLISVETKRPLPLSAKPKFTSHSSNQEFQSARNSRELLKPQSASQSQSQTSPKQAPTPEKVLPNTTVTPKPQQSQQSDHLPLPRRIHPPTSSHHVIPSNSHNKNHSLEIDKATPPNTIQPMQSPASPQPTTQAKPQLSKSLPQRPLKELTGLRIGSGRSTWEENTDESYQIPKKQQRTPAGKLSFSSGHEFPQEKESNDLRFSE